MPPTFKPGDYVKFQLSPSGLTRRWHGGIFNEDMDRGTGGPWAGAVVLEIIDDKVIVQVVQPISAPELPWACGWPLKGHLYYNLRQWGADGYLQRAEGKITQPGTKPCECGMDLLMTQGCLCGGK